MPEGRFSVELTQGAEDDLEQIYDYVSVHRSRDAALALLDAFAETMATLTQFPERGSVPDEFEVLGLREFRQILMAPYRIIYRPLASRVRWSAGHAVASRTAAAPPMKIERRQKR
jgi:toxin ParE1/3/4